MKPTIDIIIPIYNEEETIPLLIDRLEKLKSANADNQFNLICVDDGSRDRSLAMLQPLLKANDQLICLSRNFGHQIALTAGLDHSTADAAIIIDADLQDPPEVILDLIARWQDGFQIVYAQRRSRVDSSFKKFTAYVYYRLLNLLATVDIPPDTGDFRLLDREVVEALQNYPERNRFLRGIIASLGFRQTAVLFDRQPRQLGETKYPFSKMLKFAIDGILSFSVVPLKLISLVGFGAAAISMIGILYAFYMRFFRPDITVSGWTLTFIAIFFMGGVQMIMLGVMGEYIGRMYTETQGRPLYLIDSKRSKMNRSKKNR